MMIPVSTPHAPKAVGPYSQAVVHGNMVYCSGQIAVDPESGKSIRSSVAEQTRICLSNLESVLEAAGSSMKNVLTVDIAVSSMEIFEEMNQVYTTFFSAPHPARMTVASAGIYDGLDVEIKCTAYI